MWAKFDPISPAFEHEKIFKIAVFQIWRIRKFLGHADPDPLVRRSGPVSQEIRIRWSGDTDPDPSIIKRNFKQKP